MNTAKFGLPSLVLLVVGSAQSATPFSIEVTAGYGTSKVSRSGTPSADSDLTQFGITYFLQSPNIESVPLAESAYLAKSDSISVSHASIELDDFDQSTTSFKSRFVTSTNAIFNLGYDQLDSDSTSGDSFTIGYGQHITSGHSYTVDLNYVEEFDIVSLSYTNRLVQDNSGKKWSTLEFTTGIIDIGESNNLSVRLSGDSYLSLVHGIGGGISYVDLDAGSILELDLNTRYFFSDRIFAKANIIYSKVESDVDEVDGTTYALNVGARF